MSEVKRRRYNVTPEAFVRAWQGSGSVDEVAGKLKMPKAAVLSRASSYRAREVRLKAMPRAKRVNPEALNKIGAA